MGSPSQKLVKSNKSISWKTFLTEFHFLLFQKWTKINFWTGKTLSKIQFHENFAWTFLNFLARYDLYSVLISCFFFTVLEITRVIATKVGLDGFAMKIWTNAWLIQALVSMGDYVAKTKTFLEITLANVHHNLRGTIVNSEIIERVQTILA